MEKDTDEKLLQEYLAGRKEAFAEIVKRYEKDLYNFLLRFLGKPALAEEVFQEAFLQVHLSAERFEQGRRFRPWLFTIAANKARDNMRARARRPSFQLVGLDDELGTSELWGRLLRDETTPADILDKKEQCELVRDAVASLPDHLREILILAYFNQLPYKEMADELDIPLGTVKSRLHAAVAAFGKEYRERLGEKEK